MLASEEVKHYNTIALLEKHAENFLPAKTKILDDVKNIFIKMKEDTVEICFDSSGLEAYKKALIIEEMSRKFYLDKAAEVGHENEKQIFLRLAAEEDYHKRILENVVEFVARPEPGSWLENAEWHHLDEY